MLRTESTDSIGQRLALVAGEIHLHQRRLAVGALRAGRRQRIAPEVLNVLDVLGVLGELVDQAVVVVVCVGTERLVALQDDHRRTVGVELLEHLADALAGLQRRRILGAQRHVVCFGNGLQLRHEDVRDHRQAQPEQRDQHRKPPDRVRDPVGQLDWRSAWWVLIRTCPGSSSRLVQTVSVWVQRWRSPVPIENRGIRDPFDKRRHADDRRSP